MSAPLRLTLALSLVLFGGGAVVTPHALVPGWSHQGLDHPPSAVHATLLEHFLSLAAQKQTAAGGDSFLAAAPPAVALAASVLALFAFGTPRVWRPGTLGVSRDVAPLRTRRFAQAPAHGPPRASFSS